MAYGKMHSAETPLKECSRKYIYPKHKTMPAILYNLSMNISVNNHQLHPVALLVHNHKGVNFIFVHVKTTIFAGEVIM